MNPLTDLTVPRVLEDLVADLSDSKDSAVNLRLMALEVDAFIDATASHRLPLEACLQYERRRILSRTVATTDEENSGEGGVHPQQPRLRSMMSGVGLWSSTSTSSILPTTNVNPSGTTGAFFESCELSPAESGNAPSTGSGCSTPVPLLPDNRDCLRGCFEILDMEERNILNCRLTVVRAWVECDKFFNDIEEEVIRSTPRAGRSMEQPVNSITVPSTHSNNTPLSGIKARERRAEDLFIHVGAHADEVFLKAFKRALFLKVLSFRMSSLDRSSVDSQIHLIFEAAYADILSQVAEAKKKASRIEFQIGDTAERLIHSGVKKDRWAFSLEFFKRKAGSHLNHKNSTDARFIPTTARSKSTTSTCASLLKDNGSDGPGIALPG